MNETINIKAVIVDTIAASVAIQSQQISASVVVNIPTNDIACPVILCVDGGAASTASYPSINGLLNGGSA